MTTFRTNALFRAATLLLCLCVLAMLTACGRGGKMGQDYVYVSAPQVNLRDRLSTVYTKVAVVKNGERVQVLEKSKRFYRVRTDVGAEGWIELRYIVPQEVFDGFEKLKAENATAAVQAHGVARADLNIHLTPDRDGEHLYQMKEGEKIEVLKRAVAEKQGAATPKAPEKPQKTPSLKTAGDKEEEVPKIFEDWWLVRDSQKHVGWVLARMVDIDVPYDVAQYAEGQRIVSTFVLNYVTDKDPATAQVKSIPQYLMLTTEPKDGLPYDFNRLRVFTWNTRKHRYETASKDSNLFGVFPVTVGNEVFDKDGSLPTFVIHVKDVNGNTVARKYRMKDTSVRRVITPEEEQAEKADRAARAAQRRAEKSKPR